MSSEGVDKSVRGDLYHHPLQLLIDTIVSSGRIVGSCHWFLDFFHHLVSITSIHHVNVKELEHFLFLQFQTTYILLQRRAFIPPPHSIHNESCRMIPCHPCSNYAHGMQTQDSPQSWEQRVQSIAYYSEGH